MPSSVTEPQAGFISTKLHQVLMRWIMCHSVLHAAICLASSSPRRNRREIRKTAPSFHHHPGIC